MLCDDWLRTTLLQFGVLTGDKNLPNFNIIVVAGENYSIQHHRWLNKFSISLGTGDRTDQFVVGFTLLRLPELEPNTISCRIRCSSATRFGLRDVDDEKDQFFPFSSLWLALITTRLIMENMYRVVWILCPTPTTRAMNS